MALSSCCCCISLRTGGLILAVISAVSSLVMFTNGIKAEAGSLSVVQGEYIFYYSYNKSIENSLNECQFDKLFHRSRNGLLQFVRVWYYKGMISIFITY